MNMMKGILLTVVIFAGFMESEQFFFKPQMADCGGLNGFWEAHWAHISIKCLPDKSDRETGSLDGIFQNAHAAREDYYTIKGRYTLVGPDVTFGFVAAWNNRVAGNWNLTASWAGILKGDDPNTITAFWISATDNSSPDQWSSYGIGKHIFKKRENDRELSERSYF